MDRYTDANYAAAERNESNRDDLEYLVLGCPSIQKKEIGLNSEKTQEGSRIPGSDAVVSFGHTNDRPSEIFVMAAKPKKKKPRPMPMYTRP